MATYILNKKATFDFEILERYEAGLELLGYEVKALRAKRGSLEGARVLVRGDEAYLVGATVPPYQSGNVPESYDPRRTRRLLLTKRELATLVGLEAQKGLTLVPISVYNKNGKLKLEVGVARGKKKTDKRAVIQRRETNREIERTLKTR